jgi:hypothetical protein
MNWSCTLELGFSACVLLLGQTAKPPVKSSLHLEIGSSFSQTVSTAGKAHLVLLLALGLGLQPGDLNGSTHTRVCKPCFLTVVKVIRVGG